MTHIPNRAIYTGVACIYTWYAFFVAIRRAQFKRHEWYHCYSRSIDGSAAFLTVRDYERFLQALYLCNGIKQIRRGALYLPSHDSLLTLDRGEQLVSVAAYCIMPDRFHLLLREERSNGISRYMQKVGTSYSMYLNASRKRSGNIFVKPFRSQHVHKHLRAEHVVQYIHLDAADLFEDEWREGSVSSFARLQKNLAGYRYSSLRDYERYVRAENSIVDRSVLNEFSDYPAIKEVIGDASAYLAALL